MPASRRSAKAQKFQNKTDLNGKRRQWLWHNQQFRYFREFIKRQWRTFARTTKTTVTFTTISSVTSFLRKTRQGNKATPLGRPLHCHFVFLEFVTVERKLCAMNMYMYLINHYYRYYYYKPQSWLGWKQPNTSADLAWQCLGNQTMVTNF